jgi:hypothetical protein
VDPLEGRPGVVDQDVDRGQRARVGRRPLRFLGDAQIGPDRPGLPTKPLDFVRHAIGLLGVAVVMDRDVRATLRQCPADRRPDVATPARDQCRSP